MLGVPRNRSLNRSLAKVGGYVGHWPLVLQTRTNKYVHAARMRYSAIFPVVRLVCCTFRRCADWMPKRGDEEPRLGVMPVEAPL